VYIFCSPPPAKPSHTHLRKESSITRTYHRARAFHFLTSEACHVRPSSEYGRSSRPVIDSVCRSLRCARIHSQGPRSSLYLQWENASTKDGKRFMTGTEKRQAEIGDAVATGVGLPAAPLHPGKPAFRPLKTKEINVDWPVWSGEIVSASLDWVTTSHEVVSATGIKEYSLM